MKGLMYSIFLMKYGITYIDNFIGINGSKIVYGYNKSTGEYSFWRVCSSFDLELIEIVSSRIRALFSYSVLHRGNC